MRNLTDAEVLSLTSILKMERDGLIVSKAMQSLITDKDLKRQAEADILAAESRIKGMQQFINENNIITTREVL